MAVEFFIYEDELWFHNKEDGSCNKVTETSYQLLKPLMTIIENQYTDAYNKLNEHYAKITDLHYKRWKIVTRFIKCNMGNLDTSKIDWEDDNTFHFEKVSCPLRGECQLEGIVCGAKFNSHLTKQEERVAKLYCSGASTTTIANTLYISENTAHNHLRNIYRKLNVHNITQLKKKIKYEE